MKHIAVILVLFASASISFAQPTWKWQNPLPQGNTLNSISAVDENIAWAVGDVGTILFTTDGGNTWVSQISGVPYNLHGVSAIDSKNSWAVGEQGTILHTTNGGLTWIIFKDSNYYFNAVQFINPIIGWAVGYSGNYSGKIIQTTNGGVTWNDQKSPSGEKITSISFVDTNNGWIVGDSGIYHTSNAGVIWVSQKYQAASTRIQFTSVSFVDTLYGWAIGSYYDTSSALEAIVLVTTDGGQVWQSNFSRSWFNFNSISFTDVKNGKIVGGNPAQILITSDGGSSWATHDIPNSEGLALNCVSSLNKNSFWAVGVGGNILRSTDGGMMMNSQIKGGTGESLQSLFFLDSNRCWAAGQFGSVVYTTNGGAQWVSQASLNSSLSSIVFMDSINGWVIGEKDNNIFRTGNGGLTWSTNFFGRDKRVKCLYFIDANNGWAAGYAKTGIIWNTTDGGNTWIVKDSSINNAMWFSIFFKDRNNGWAVGYDGLVVHTTDGGNSWVEQSTTTTDFLQKVFFIDAKNGWIVGLSHTILHTTNAGSTWVVQAIPTLLYSGNFRDIFFSNSNTGWCVGEFGTILYTTNGGNTWLSQENVSTNHLYGVAFSSPKSGWIVGDYGTILHTSNGSDINDIKFPSANNPVGLENYPNPLNSSTTFNYNLPKSSFTTLRIINSLGEEVSKLVSEVESEGTHGAKWDAHDMPNGIYFCELRSGAYSQSVRVVVMK